MTTAGVADAARARHLALLGGLHTPPGHALRHEDAETILLLGPDEPGFWPAFEARPEMTDGQADPLDRWSTRQITALAEEVGAAPLFPFGGPPYLPFISWALDSGRCHTSPVRLLVHDHAGLFVSFRGALAFRERLALPAPVEAPCKTCAQPCRSACPADALTPEGYDTGRCHAYLDTPEGADCMTRGCAVRRACPVGAALRLPAQSAFHMRAFHP